MASLRTDDAAAESYSPLGRRHPSNPDNVGQQPPGFTREQQAQQRPMEGSPWRSRRKDCYRRELTFTGST